MISISWCNLLTMVIYKIWSIFTSSKTNHSTRRISFPEPKPYAGHWSIAIKTILSIGTWNQITSCFTRRKMARSIWSSQILGLVNESLRPPSRKPKWAHMHISHQRPSLTYLRLEKITHLPGKSTVLRWISGVWAASSIIWWPWSIRLLKDILWITRMFS